MDDAFLRSAEPYRGALRVHCYRMLGSSSEVDDVMQEILVRAWRARESLGAHDRMRPWLYRIATNVCLDELAQRPRRLLANDFGAPAQDPAAELAAPLEEPIWLEPMPSAWLDADEDPASALTKKESVALAFVAALHLLTAPQRAVLLLRDVVGFSAEETAASIGMSVSATNSALHRARTAVAERLGSDRPHVEDVDRELLERYLRAWQTSDVEVIVSLLRDDVQTTMPPRPTWILGRADNEQFYRHKVTDIAWATPLQLRHTSANGAPALAFFRPGESGEFELRALQVLTFQGGLLARIDHFMTKEAFPAFGLSL